MKTYPIPAIALNNPKYAHNVGAVIRAASCFFGYIKNKIITKKMIIFIVSILLFSVLLMLPTIVRSMEAPQPTEGLKKSIPKNNDIEDAHYIDIMEETK